MKRLIYLALAILALASCTKTEEDPTISVSGKTEYYLAAAGESISVTVTSNREDWTWSVGDASWLSASKDGGGLKLTAAPNEAYDPRNTTVTVSAGVATASFKVIQAASIFVPELSVDVDNPSTVPCTAGSFEVKVATNLEGWEYSCEEQAWITVVPANGGLKFEFKENTAENERKYEVMLYAPTKDDPLMQVKFVLIQAENDIQYEKTDLSAGGTSNCYLITHKGPYEFSATVRGNGKTVEGLKAPEALSPAGATLVWQTTFGVINSVSLSDGKIQFEAGKKSGSAVLAATDANGKIIWSWHIWRPEIAVEELASESGAKVMNMNLGALHNDPKDSESFGMLYQWGRKDPFPGAPVTGNGSLATDNKPVYDIDGKEVTIKGTSMYNSSDNTLAFSIANPAVCISNNAQYKTTRDWLRPAESNGALWGNPNGSERNESTYVNKGSKTYYDPCPVGWRVPHMQVFNHLTPGGGMVWASGDSEGVLTWSNLGGEAHVAIRDINSDGNINILDFENGWWLYMKETSPKTWSYFPATTRYDGQYAMLMGSMVGLWANYWYNTPTEADSTTGTAEAMSFGIKDYYGGWSVTLSAISSGSRADAYAVRCIKE